MPPPARTIRNLYHVKRDARARASFRLRQDHDARLLPRPSSRPRYG
ncbi:hypothetical protein SUS17_2029 [Sphingomonas sp. S17]|nr:hypothetical protein SUS17_2029 [Sphingomonas sp. S17]